MMRVISQNGEIDLPYDAVVLSLDEGYIYADVIGGESKYIMAGYATSLEAEMEFKRLHMSYEMMNTSVFRFKARGRKEES